MATATKQRKLKTPYADLVPPLADDEFSALQSDCQRHGIRESVKIDEADNILDGHHRYRIYAEAAPKYRKTTLADCPTCVIAGLTEEQKQAFVLRSISARRNLSTEQKAELRHAMCKRAKAWRQVDPKFWTQQRVADELGVRRQRVSEWFVSDAKSGKANNRSPDQTAGSERRYFQADARLKLSKEATEQVADAALGGERHEQVAANYGVSRSRVTQIVNREVKRREKAAARKAAMQVSAAVVDGDQNVRHGDWQSCALSLADASVELIFTDPPYHKEAVPHYASLAEVAVRVLVPGGSLVTFCGNGTLPRVLASMTAVEGLRYYWLCACVHTGKKTRMNRSGIVNGFKPLLWFIKGSERFDQLRFVEDCIISQQEKTGHRWQQSEIECAAFVEALTGPDGLIFDPFGGSGTTAVVAKRLGRRWLLSDVDTESVAMARSRVSEA